MNASKKLVIVCTIVTLIAISAATYFIYDQIHPIKCTTKFDIIDNPYHLSMGTRLSPRPTEILCEDNNKIYDMWSIDVMYTGSNNRCAYKTTTCIRE